MRTAINIKGRVAFDQSTQKRFQERRNAYLEIPLNAATPEVVRLEQQEEISRELYKGLPFFWKKQLYIPPLTVQYMTGVPPEKMVDALFIFRYITVKNYERTSIRIYMKEGYDKANDGYDNYRIGYPMLYGGDKQHAHIVYAPNAKGFWHKEGYGPQFPTRLKVRPFASNGDKSCGLFYFYW